MTSAQCTIDSFSGRFRQDIEITLPREGLLRVRSDLGPRRLNNACLDLLDLAAVVFHVERQMTGRQRTEPAARVHLRMPVRSARTWTRPTLQLVEEILQFLGNASWEVTTTSRRLVSPPGVMSGMAEPVQRVALFSGGLDSLCGAAVTPRKDTRLVSFYTRQRQLQVQLAEGLGYGSCIQWNWRTPLRQGRGRGFYYRSFLFMSIAGVTAFSLRASEILQCENGVLANAVPPSPAYRMTRHAHPHSNALMEQILNRVLRSSLTISNPLLLLTKRQAFEQAVATLGQEFASNLATSTQSCWGLWSPRLPGGGKKKPGLHCGVCVPCLVRRTALRDNNYARDVRKARWANHDSCGRNIRAYHAFLERVRASHTSDPRFFLLLDGLSRTDLVGRGYVTVGQLRSLYSSFAVEFAEALL